MHSSPDTPLTLARLERALLWNLHLLEALKEDLDGFKPDESVVAARRDDRRQPELSPHEAVRPLRGAPERRFLEDVAQRIREFAIPSLAGKPVVVNGVLESRQGLGALARIRVREMPGRVLVHVDACTARTRRKLHRKHLPQRLQQRLSAYQATAVVVVEEKTVAACAIRVDLSNSWALNLSLTRVALAFIEVRKALMTDLGDFTRGPVYVLEASPRSAGQERQMRALDGR